MDNQPKTLKLKHKNLFLSENPVLRYLAFSALYMAQGIPEGITYFAIPAWLAMNNKTPIEIASFVAVIGIPWSFKILIAPLMDRFTILSMGRKRPWVIFGQLGLIVSFLSIGFVQDPLNNLNGLMIAGFFISFFGAFQDVATDGMAIDIIPINQQARANGLMWGFKIIGSSLALVIGTSLINKLGLTTAISSLSIAVAIIILVPICFRERPNEKLFPWTKGEASQESREAQLKTWGQIFKNLLRVIILPSTIFMGMASVINGAMYGLIDTFLPIFTIQELGWTNTSFSQVYSITTIIGVFFGMFVGGALIDFFGDKKMLIIYLTATLILITALALLPNLWGNDKIIFGFILFYYLFYTFICIGMFAACMKLCWQTVAATQFTLFMALNNMGRAAGSGLLGTFKELMSWEYVLLCTALSPLLTIVFIKLINFKKQREAIDTFSNKTKMTF
ncbi:MFS transporter [Mariniflexile sp. AS56]|uniref:MFS transporter n=1 Tax=Mariniflexile sp. AS56 TaxID=3063957 RepID=UPI0026EE1F93|nr:MFS transporter [Mariniflexile sp. AS56]MDO7171492.1 MFS transporter [Mariniflexile sp. AS56]